MQPTHNRLAEPDTRRPGRPSKADLAQRPPPEPTRPVAIVTVEGLLCPACGRGVTLRRCTRQHLEDGGVVTWGSCSACARRLRRHQAPGRDTVQRI